MLRNLNGQQGCRFYRMSPKPFPLSMRHAVQKPKKLCARMMRAKLSVIMMVTVMVVMTMGRRDYIFNHH